MTIVDANVLLYAVNRSDPQHTAASRWFVRALNGADILGIPWMTILAFIRLSTSARVFPSPLSVGDAFGLVHGWIARRSVVVPAPTARHLEILHGLVIHAGTAGSLVTDAHLAALAIEHGARVASFDRDFLRFASLQLIIPSG